MAALEFEKRFTSPLCSLVKITPTRRTQKEREKTTKEQNTYKISLGGSFD